MHNCYICYLQAEFGITDLESMFLIMKRNFSKNAKNSQTTKCKFALKIQLLVLKKVSGKAKNTDTLCWL